MQLARFSSRPDAHPSSLRPLAMLGATGVGWMILVLGITNMAFAGDLSHPPGEPRIGAIDLPALIQAFGSHQGRADVQFTMAQGNREYEQQSNYRWEINADHHRHVILQTPVQTLELWHRPPAVFIRFDTGKIREKNEREMDVEQWENIGPSSFAHCLLGLQHVTFSSQQISPWEGVPAERWTLARETSGQGPNHLPNPWQHPSALRPPWAGWREQAQLRDVVGHIVVDKERHVLLQGELDGRLDIKEAQGEPIQLRLRCQYRLSKLGKPNPIKFPSKFIPELRRSQRIKDPLAFFRSELPPAAGTPGP